MAGLLHLRTGGSWVSHKLLLPAVLLACATSVAQGASIEAQSFASQAEFQASPLYAYLQTLPGGLAAHAPTLVTGIQQGTLIVPQSSAGFAGCDDESGDVTSAMVAVPTVMSGATDSASYHKLFVSLGHEVSGTSPYLALALPPVWTGTDGGFQGYDIAIFDLGENLVSDTGGKNRERTNFEVQLESEGVPYDAGEITNTGGDYINVILVDVTGTPGIPTMIDELYLYDAVGTINPTSESLDVHGVLRLNYGPPTPAALVSWGRLKSMYQ